MTPTIKKIQQIVAVNENDSTTLNYAYCEDIGDGRGPTCGIAGWNDDLDKILPLYPSLAHYMNQRSNLGEQFAKDWAASAQDQVFRDLQDKIQYDEYFAPAIAMAASYGIVTEAGQAIFCDAAIQQGMDGDPDSLNLMAKHAHDKVLAAGEEKVPATYEAKYLSALCDIRHGVLMNPYNHKTKKDWQKSVDRSDELKKFVPGWFDANNVVNQGNIDLVTPFVYNPWGDEPGFTVAG